MRHGCPISLEPFAIMVWSDRTQSKFWHLCKFHCWTICAPPKQPINWGYFSKGMHCLWECFIVCFSSPSDWTQNSPETLFFCYFSPVSLFFPLISEPWWSRVIKPSDMCKLVQIETFSIHADLFTNQFTPQVGLYIQSKIRFTLLCLTNS